MRTHHTSDDDIYIMRTLVDPYVLVDAASITMALPVARGRGFSVKMGPLAWCIKNFSMLCFLDVDR